jgi:hypothetical protein
MEYFVVACGLIGRDNEPVKNDWVANFYGCNRLIPTSMKICLDAVPEEHTWLEIIIAKNGRF